MTESSQPIESQADDKSREEVIRVGFNDRTLAEEQKLVDREIALVENEIERAKANGAEQAVETLEGPKRLLLSLRDQLSGKKEATARALEIYQRNPANHEEIVEMVHGLTYKEMRREELIAKYGKDCFARCRAFFAGELDSHLISGVKARQDKAESTRLGRFSRRAVISIFNRKNIYAAGAAIAVGVLTGGIGGIAAGVVVGGIVGRGAGEAWESIRGEEKSARGTLLEKEREYWLRLQDLASDYKNASEEEKVEKLKILIDEFNKNSNSAAIIAMAGAREDLAATIKRWSKTKLIVQIAGGLAGGAAGFAANAFWMHGFSGVDMDYQLHNKLGQQAFHNVQKINGVWHFAYKTGEAMSHPLAQNGALWHTTGEAAWRIYAAAAAKAAPTIAAFLLANLGRKKSDPKDSGVFRDSARFYSNRVTTPADSGREVREEVVETATLSPRKEARAETAPEGVMTRAETLDDTDYKFSRSAAELILALVPKYKDLDGANEEERKKKFLEAAKKILMEQLTVHYRNEHKKDRSDLDGETVLALIKDILGAEFKDPKDKFVAPGESKEGHLTTDSGGFHAINVPKGEGTNLFSDTVNVDHHGKESGNDLSASLLMFNILKNWGFYEGRNPEEVKRLEKLVEFVTHFDNMTGPYKNMDDFKKSYGTVLGLRRFMGARRLYNFFTKNKNPDPLRELTDQELIAFKQKGRNKNDKGEEEDYDNSVKLLEQIKKDLELLESIEKVDTPHGKAVIDNRAKLSKEAFAASGYDIHVQMFVDDKTGESKGFKISNMPEGIELPDGQKIRGMWICNKKPKNGTTLESIKTALAASSLAKAA